MDVRENRLSGAEVYDSKPSEGRSAAVARHLFFGMLWAFWGYVLGGTALPFGASPFGVALLAAADRRALWVLLGLSLWALGEEDAAVWLCLFLAVLLVRLLVRFLLDLPARLRGKGGELTLGAIAPHLLREHMALRMANAAVATFAVGFLRLQTGGYLFYDLYSTILSVAVAPVAVLLLYGLFEGDREGWQYQLGFLTLGTLLCFGGASLRLYGISLSVFGAMFASLYVSRRRGIVAGMVTGTLLGLGISPALAPAFAFGALSGGLLFRLSAGLGCLGSFVASVAWGYYVEGIGILGGSFAALLSASALFAVWDRLFGHEKKEEVAEISEPTETHGGLEARVRLLDSVERIRTLSRGFSELGKTFDLLARSEYRPEQDELMGICERAFDACCTSCPCKEECWGAREDETRGAIEGICRTLAEKGRVRREEISGSLSERCGRLSDILEEIGHNASQYEAFRLSSDRSEIFSEDFRMISDILTSLMSGSDGEYELDGEAADQLTRRLLEEGISAEVCAIGKRQRRILFGGDGAVLAGKRREILRLAEECLAIPLREKRWEEDEGLLELVQTPRLSAGIAVRTVLADGEVLCGDTALSFSGEDGRVYALISDGMGSGRAASNTSGVAGLFLRRLIEAGAGCEESLRLLNVFLRNRGSGAAQECSATVDLLALDLLEGRAELYKCGAAPTYVFRSGGVFKLRSETLPVGILREPDVKRISLEVAKGDLWVMVSDGVTQGREECPRLYDLIRSHGARADSERLSDLLLKYAKEEGSADDISTVILRIEAA